MRTKHSLTLAGLMIGLMISPAPFRSDVEEGTLAFGKLDVSTALPQIQFLARVGVPAAQNVLGVAFATGRGVPYDMAQAIQWYRAAAEQGNADGQFHLGSIYLTGSGADRNISEGLRLLRNSAGQGLTASQVFLGMAMAEGKFVPQDVVEGDMWLRLAAAHGDDFAEGRRARFEERMTDDQLAMAQTLAETFKPAPLPKSGMETVKHLRPEY